MEVRTPIVMRTGAGPAAKAGGRTPDRGAGRVANQGNDWQGTASYPVRLRIDAVGGRPTCFVSCINFLTFLALYFDISPLVILSQNHDRGRGPCAPPRPRLPLPAPLPALGRRELVRLRRRPPRE